MADTGIQPYTNARIDYLATYLQSLLPGLNKQVAVTWITAEKGVSGNVLGTTYNNASGQHLFQYGSQEAGLRDAASWINTRSIYSGVKNSLSQSAQAQATALAASPWNHAYYTGVFANLSKTGPSTSTASQTWGNVFGLDPSTKVTQANLSTLAGKLNTAEIASGIPNPRGIAGWNTYLFDFLGHPLSDILPNLNFTDKGKTSLGGVPTPGAPDLNGVIMTLGVIFVGIAFLLLAGLLIRGRK